MLNYIRNLILVLIVILIPAQCIGFTASINPEYNPDDDLPNYIVGLLYNDLSSEECVKCLKAANTNAAKREKCLDNEFVKKREDINQWMNAINVYHPHMKDNPLYKEFLALLPKIVNIPLTIQKQYPHVNKEKFTAMQISMLTHLSWFLGDVMDGWSSAERNE